MKSYIERKQALLKWFQNNTNEDIAVAFSGGVDSSLLLKLACDAALEHGSRVYAFTIHTTLHPIGELDLTKTLAEEMGALHKVITVDELREAGISDNPVNRCYLCKRCMFSKLIREAGLLGVHKVVDGTNEDDAKAYRPGIKAVKELGVSSPLLAHHITKEEVRSMAAGYGISVADRPSAPCLATRFPYHTPLMPEELQKVNALEELLRGMGFYNVRCRIHDSLVRLEVDTADLSELLKHREVVIQAAKALGYDYITMDMEGFRSGSQDIHLQVTPV